MSTIIIIVLAHIFLMASTCVAFVIQQPSIYTNCFISLTRHNLQSKSYQLYASTNNNDDKDTTTIKDHNKELASHYTSTTILSWLQKMADSYQVEEGEDLLTVLTREGSIIPIMDDTNNNIDDDTLNYSS